MARDAPCFTDHPVSCGNAFRSPADATKPSECSEGTVKKASTREEMPLEPLKRGKHRLWTRRSQTSPPQYVLLSAAIVADNGSCAAYERTTAMNSPVGNQVLTNAIRIAIRLPYIKPSVHARRML